MLNNPGWLNGIVYGNNSFVAVGSSSIMQSDNGLFAAITAAPPDHHYAASYSSQIFNIANVGSTNLNIGTVAMSGTGFSDFTRVDDFCSGRSLEPSKTCSIKIAFTPHSAGPKSAILNILSNDPDSAILDVPLSGLAILKGDINGDGIVNIQDVILAAQVLVGLKPSGVRPDYIASNTDVDGDNRIGLTELMDIIQIAAGLRSSF
jgi:hypothetical protein